MRYNRETESVPKIIRNSTINLYLNSNQHFRVLLKLLPYFYLKKDIMFSIGNGQPMQGTSTVPIVSAHFSINQSVDFYTVAKAVQPLQEPPCQ